MLWFLELKSGVVERFRRRYILKILTDEIQTAKVACLQRKTRLSEFSAYSDGSHSQFIRISGVPLYTKTSFSDNLHCVSGSGLIIQRNIFGLVEKLLRFYKHENASMNSISLCSRLYRVHVKAQVKIHIFCKTTP